MKPYPTSATPYKCHTLQVPHPTSATPYKCHTLQVPHPTSATPYKCHTLQVPHPTSATPYKCHTLQVPHPTSATPYKCHTLQCRYHPCHALQYHAINATPNCATLPCVLTWINKVLGEKSENRFISKSPVNFSLHL